MFIQDIRLYIAKSTFSHQSSWGHFKILEGLGFGYTIILTVRFVVRRLWPCFGVGNEHLNHICSGEVLGESQPKPEFLGACHHCSCVRRDDHQCIYPYGSYSSLFAFSEGEKWGRISEVLKEVDSWYPLIPSRRKEE